MRAGRRTLRLHRWLFAVALLFLGAYAVNIALRMAHIKFGAGDPRLGDVGEFLLVLSCMIAFVAGLLALERDDAFQRNNEEET